MSSPAKCANTWESPQQETVQVRLMDTPLWNQFKTHTNEMILTKLGRRLFPEFKISVSGLEENCMYSISLEFVRVNSHRWKYTDGEWVAGMESNPLRPKSDTIYTHPDSPNFGAHWMHGVVSFGALKLSNKADRTGKVVLDSLHKYQPHVHITKVEIPAPIKCVTKSFTFTETQFITVTAYQNEEIIALKIEHNPFAKGSKKRTLLVMQTSDCNTFDYDYPNTSTSPQMSQYIYSPPLTQLRTNFHLESETFEGDQKRFAPYFQPANYGNNQLDSFHPYPTTSYSSPYDNYQTLDSHQAHNEDFDLPQPSEDWSHFDTFPHFV